MTDHSPSNVSTHVQRGRDFYDWLNMAIKTAGVTLAVFAAFGAADALKLHFQEELLDQQLKFANEALMAAGQIEVAPDWEHYEHAVDAFAVLKHGPGLALFGGDNEIYNAMYEYWRFCQDQWEHRKGGYDSAAIFNTVEPKLEDLAGTFHKNLLTPGVAALVKASRHP